MDKQHRTPYATAIRAQLEFDKHDYLAIAKHARDGLIGSNWTNFLSRQFRHQREHVEEQSLDLARAIWALGSPLVITTNYDHILRWACPRQDDLDTWDIDAPANQLSFLQGGTLPPTIWYLHGKIDNAANIILTSDGYQHLYPEARQGETEKAHRAALQTLHNVLASYTFLFIGFSLDDHYFGMQLKGVNEIYKGMAGPHFVLAREAERSRISSLDSSLHVIPFEEFGEPLLHLVRELGDIARAKETPEALKKISTADEVPVAHIADYGPHHSVFFVPFRQKGDQVIGREGALHEVRKQLTEGRRTAIGQTVSFQGLGGLGKTQLAVEYAYRFRDEYPNGVIWLNADQDIDAQLTELAGRARWVAPESEHKYKLEVAKHRLRTFSDCLIIFDNLEHVESLDSYLPEAQANPHLLVTSRIDQPSFNPIHIDPLDEALSLELLFQEAGREPLRDDERFVATLISKELGGLPLALELAGGYLRHRQVGWQQYLNLLNQNPRAALLSKFPTFTRHEADIYSTLKINEEIFREEPRLRNVLDLLTWSGSAPMGLSLMSKLLGTRDDTELTSALGLGLQLRLLQK
ncbi:MAG: SIR2 family protein, partial [Pyrinomonadaceae bacterium]